MKHVTHANESCHTYKRVMSRIQTSHAIHPNDSLVNTNESSFAHTIRSCHTYRLAMSHIQMSRVTHMNESCRTGANAKVPETIGHDSFICVPWLTHMCAMTRSYVRHDSFICRAGANAKVPETGDRHDRWLCRWFVLSLATHKPTNIHTHKLPLCSVIAMIAGYAVGSYFLSPSLSPTYIHSLSLSLFRDRHDCWLCR